MTGTRLSQVPGVDAAAERPVASALARVNYYHSASTAGTPHEPAPWCRESTVTPARPRAAAPPGARQVTAL
jgi:hypothetical protein